MTYSSFWRLKTDAVGQGRDRHGWNLDWTFGIFRLLRRVWDVSGFGFGLSLAPADVCWWLWLFPDYGLYVDD